MLPLLGEKLKIKELLNQSLNHKGHEGKERYANPTAEGGGATWVFQIWSSA